MKFFIQLHHYMVIGLILTVLGSFNNNFAMKRPSLNTKQQDLCALLPDLDPHGPQEDYNEFAKKMIDQKLTTCLCVIANRYKQSRENIETFHKKIAEVTNGAVVITPEEYYRRVTQPVQALLNKTPKPGDPKTMITYKDPFSPQIKKILEETYKEYRLGFPIKVKRTCGQGTGVRTKFNDFGNRIERLQIDCLDVQDEKDSLQGLFAHEIAGHSKNGDSLREYLHKNLYTQKIEDSNIELTEVQETDLNNIYMCILKDRERDADQNPCACGNLSSASNIVTFHKDRLQKNNSPEGRTHPSDLNRYNDTLRILRLKKAESTLGGIPDILPQNPIRKAFSSKWFT